MRQDADIQRAENEEDGSEAESTAAEIDLEALARQVYELLKEELWLEKDRQGWRKLW